MTLRTIHDVDFTGKRVLLRVDFNVLLDEKKDAQDTYKIESARASINHILSFEDVRLALISHRGRPKGKVNKEFTMGYLADDVERLLARTCKFACSSIGVCVVEALENLEGDEILLLENARFHEGEEADDDFFAQQLAAPFDIYVNDAFSVCHRAHASVHAVTKHLPSYAGLWLAKEIENLDRIKDAPESPAIAIIGGAKLETKVPLIAEFEKSYDKILVGGRVAVSAQEKEMTFTDKVLLPEDFAENKYDIGVETIDTFVAQISTAKTIVWNGPMGKFEEKPFDKGTRALAEAIGSNEEAFSVVGGGESVQALHESGYFDKVSFVSTGGGAMLSFLSGEPMPGLEVLKET